jgi:hypothetical protein
MYDPAEQDLINEAFSLLLREATKDGGAKRAKGEKVPWYVDRTHEPHFWNHISAWKRGETKDGDSGAHPLVHAAWRLLAIAYQENAKEGDDVNRFDC